jgi:mono/diheme cytochrome c family protein
MALIAAAGLVIGVAGCVEPNPEEASTPKGAATVANSAPQTDSEGKTVPTPGAETTGGETTTAGPAEGDVAAGKTFFEGTCQGCHTNLGQAAGAGPKLAGLGLSADRIRDQVVNGGAVMPAGLASGTDLDNVVAFVLSIQ